VRSRVKRTMLAAAILAVSAIIVVSLLLIRLIWSQPARRPQPAVRQSAYGPATSSTAPRMDM
jgi:hypothetical protein